ncbi:MAG TPA: hypothetical protein PK453_26540 [Leptospiraceae bacterium]|nr:hypothetical protein [Leptospiraceae bacterium]HMY68831.1 hypothetical protein [Leptospiraceae bacterium]HNF17244.1 hypothetical protein [Leptospiraceae bacterium]HNF27061.1 hypothetical protein [Leptospiraceae bacterium]HNI97494.1 hypothetical protein [Leptospiraceae bacterium]
MESSIIFKSESIDSSLLEVIKKKFPGRKIEITVHTEDDETFFAAWSEKEKKFILQKPDEIQDTANMAAFSFEEWENKLGDLDK